MNLSTTREKSYSTALRNAELIHLLEVIPFPSAPSDCCFKLLVNYIIHHAQLAFSSHLSKLLQQLTCISG